MGSQDYQLHSLQTGTLYTSILLFKLKQLWCLKSQSPWSGLQHCLLTTHQCPRQDANLVFTPTASISPQQPHLWHRLSSRDLLQPRPFGHSLLATDIKQLLVLQIFSHLCCTSHLSLHPVLISWWWHLAFHLPFFSIAPKLHHFFILTVMKLTANSCKTRFLTWNHGAHPYSGPVSSVVEFYHSSSLWAKLILFKGFADYWRLTHRTRNTEL